MRAEQTGIDPFVERDAFRVCGLAEFRAPFFRLNLRQIEELRATEKRRCSREIEVIADHHPRARPKVFVCGAGSIREDQALYSGRGQNSNCRSDLPGSVPFIKMNAALRKNNPAFADLSEDKTASVSRYGRRRQFAELRITNSFLGVGFGNQNVQTGAEHDRQIGIPRAEAIESRVAHDQAAEMGGADSGFRVPAITSGCKDPSRIGVIFESCFG